VAGARSLIDLHALGKTVQDLARLGRRTRVLYLCS
jgi:hypothetical protein